MKPVTYTRHPKYDYVLTSDLERRLPWELGNHDFRDEKGNIRLQFRGRLAIVKKGYAWDGASCAPDFRDVIIASCLHDAMCQFRHLPCFPLSKAQIDKAFLDEMPAGFIFRKIYWAAVRAFGGVYASVARQTPSGSCTLPHDTPACTDDPGGVASVRHETDPCTRHLRVPDLFLRAARARRVGRDR